MDAMRDVKGAALMEFKAQRWERAEESPPLSPSATRCCCCCCCTLMRLFRRVGCAL